MKSIEVVTSTGTGTNTAARRREAGCVCEELCRASGALREQHVGLFAYDTTTRESRWSATVHGVAGFDETGQPPNRRGPPQRPGDRATTGTLFEHVVDDVLEHLREHGPSTGTHRIVDPSGTERWLLISARLEQSEPDAHEQMIGWARDITQEVQGEEQLRRSLALNQAVLDSLPDHVLVLRRDGTIVGMNAAWREANAGSELDVADNYFESLATSEWTASVAPDAVFAAIDDLLTGRSSTLHLEFSNEVDAERRWFSVDARAVEGVDDLFFAVTRDDTERRAATLDALHSQKLEAVGQLAGGIAHEINTPIQFIGDNLRFIGESARELLGLVTSYRDVVARLSSPDDLARLSAAEQRADLAYVEREMPLAIAQALDGVQRVATIVSAMKAFGHHGDSSEKVPADLNAIVETTLVVARSEVKHVADVELHLAELPLVLCNVGDMNQVILNLVVNAAHAIADADTEGGSRGVLAVSTFATTDEVVVQVRDNGCGIPDDVRDRIFEPFFTTKGVGRGTGQGLAIVYSVVVDRHGGALHVDSTPGRGTTFEIRLPRRPPREVAA